MQEIIELLELDWTLIDLRGNWKLNFIAARGPDVRLQVLVDPKRRLGGTRDIRRVMWRVMVSPYLDTTCFSYSLANNFLSQRTIEDVVTLRGFKRMARSPLAS